jgi:hypothetical protein
MINEYIKNNTLNKKALKLLVMRTLKNYVSISQIKDITDLIMEGSFEKELEDQIKKTYTKENEIKISEINTLLDKIINDLKKISDKDFNIENIIIMSDNNLIILPGKAGNRNDDG